jgi:hypothetical protein
MVYLELADDLISETYYLANSLGQVLRKGVFKTNSSSLDLAELPAGTYFFYVAGLPQYQLIQLR